MRPSLKWGSHFWVTKCHILYEHWHQLVIKQGTDLAISYWLVFGARWYFSLALHFNNDQPIVHSHLIKYLQCILINSLCTDLGVLLLLNKQPFSSTCCRGVKHFHYITPKLDTVFGQSFTVFAVCNCTQTRTWIHRKNASLYWIWCRRQNPMHACISCNVLYFM